jgi:hypothetical protein
MSVPDHSTMLAAKCREILANRASAVTRVTLSRALDEVHGIEVRAHLPQNRRMALHLPMILVAVQLTAAPEIPAKTLHAAEARAAHIFASAGIQLQFTAPGLHLQIVARDPQGLATDTAGFAVLIPGDSGYAAVSWPTVQRGAQQMEVDPAVLLGAAIAHELGHLLFGPAHAHSGIMSPRLGRKEMELAARGELRFEAVKKLQAVVTARVSTTGFPSPLNLCPCSQR